MDRREDPPCLQQVAGTPVCNRADVSKSWEVGHESCSFFLSSSISLFCFRSTGASPGGRKLVCHLWVPNPRPILHALGELLPHPTAQTGGSLQPGDSRPRPVPGTSSLLLGGLSPVVGSQVQVRVLVGSEAGVCLSTRVYCRLQVRGTPSAPWHSLPTLRLLSPAHGMESLLVCSARNACALELLLNVAAWSPALEGPREQLCVNLGFLLAKLAPCGLVCSCGASTPTPTSLQASLPAHRALRLLAWPPAAPSPPAQHCELWTLSPDRGHLRALLPAPWDRCEVCVAGGVGGQSPRGRSWWPRMSPGLLTSRDLPGLLCGFSEEKGLYRQSGGAIVCDVFFIP